MKKILGLSACVAIGLSVACGSSDDMEGGSPRALPLDELHARYPAAVCDAFQDCLGELFEIYLGGESCLTIAEPAFSDELDRLERLIADGTVKYDGTRAEACLQAVAAQGCSDAGPPTACVEMLDGTVAVGGECSSTAECEGADSYCKSEGSCPGRCAPAESAEGPCMTNDDCQPGLRCNRDEGRCFSPAGAGDRCEGRTEPDCAEGLFCLGKDNDQGQPGNCRTIDEAFAGSSGEPCLFDAPLCQADLRCVVESVDTSTGSIIANCRSPVTSGAACKLAIPDLCPADEYCAVPADALDGVCTKKPGAGAACAARGNDPAEICAVGTRCDAGQCRPRQKLGGSCQSHDVCYSEHCSSGRCAPAGACE